MGRARGEVELGGGEVKKKGGCAEGGTVSENYIGIRESGSICPLPKVNVTFDGQKLTFDEEDSAKFEELVKSHFRKLAGLKEGEE